MGSGFHPDAAKRPMVVPARCQVIGAQNSSAPLISCCMWHRTPGDCLLLLHHYLTERADACMKHGSMSVAARG